MNEENKEGISTSANVQDLEVKDAQIIFDAVWHELVSECGEQLHFPTEIFWVNGAPGAGKGTHTATMMDYRGFTAPPIVISDLLTTPEAQKRINAGLLVGDREVCGLLFRELLKEEYTSGAVVDGFPRTMVQVQVLRLFYEKLLQLNYRSFEEKWSRKVKKPRFHILVLFVDEEESVRRQKLRGQKAIEHNHEVEASGIGELIPVRQTDLDETAARKRYQVFKEKTYEPLKTLRSLFYFHFINTQGSIEAARDKILEELRYQSTLELNESTHARLARLPLASKIVQHARQDLIERLEDYEENHSRLFREVVETMEDKFMPIVKRHAISGRAYVNSEDPLFDNHLALAMLIDIFTERGYHAAVDIRKERIPVHFNTNTGQIETREKRIYRVLVWFQGSEIRRGR